MTKKLWLLCGIYAYLETILDLKAPLRVSELKLPSQYSCNPPHVSVFLKWRSDFAFYVVVYFELIYYASSTEQLNLHLFLCLPSFLEIVYMCSLFLSFVLVDDKIWQTVVFVILW